MKLSTDDQTTGKPHEIKGRSKENVGKLIRNPDLEAEGRAEKISAKFKTGSARLKKPSGNKQINIALGDERGQNIMAQSVLERTGDRVAEAARKASRAASAVADALEDGVGAARRVAKQGDAAEEFLDDTTKRLQRHPIETRPGAWMVALGARNGLSLVSAIPNLPLPALVLSCAD